MTYAEACFGKKVEEMNMGEVQDAIARMEDDFRSCEEIGQGISSKESGTHRDLKEHRATLFLIEKTGITDPAELAKLRDGFAKLFAPA